MGYCTPDQFRDRFVHFSQNLQNISEKEDMFLVGNILTLLTTALELHLLKWLLIYEPKYGKYWFSHTVYNTFTTMVYTTEIKLWFLSFLEHL